MSTAATVQEAGPVLSDLQAAAGAAQHSAIGGAQLSALEVDEPPNASFREAAAQGLVAAQRTYVQVAALKAGPEGAGVPVTRREVYRALHALYHPAGAPHSPVAGQQAQPKSEPAGGRQQQQQQQQQQRQQQNFKISKKQQKKEQRKALKREQKQLQQRQQAQQQAGPPVESASGLPQTVVLSERGMEWQRRTGMVRKNNGQNA